VISEVSKLYTRLLFPQWCRKVGFILFLLGIVAAYLIYILNTKPDFLDIKVFAVFSYYFDKKYFSVIKNNAGEEIIIIPILIGLFLLTFSKLKNESVTSVMLRLQAIFISVYINTFFLVLSVVFVYGLGFIAITIANCFSGLLINAIVFWVLLIKQKNQKLIDGTV